MKELPDCGIRHEGWRFNATNKYCLWDCEWIMNPLYKFDTEFERESPNYPSASIPLKTVTDDIPDADQILLISQIYRQAG